MIGSKLDIFKKEWLDVVFDGRNKAYGAYQLRKLSPKATNIGLFSASIVFVLLLLSPAIARWIGVDLGADEPTEQIIETEVVLQEPPPVNEEEPPPPPPIGPTPPRPDQVRIPAPDVLPAEQGEDGRAATGGQH